MAKDSKRRDVVTQPNLFGRHASKGSGLSLQNPDEAVEPTEDTSLTVGAQLRAAREVKGLTLHQVADVLRLRASQVHALEEGDFNSLPGQTFVTGFLRSYANLLDLDAVAIVELYKHEEGNGLHVPSLAFPEPTSGGRIPGAGILLGTLVLALILLAGWFLYQESESLDFERVAELPDHLAGKIRNLESSELANATIPTNAQQSAEPSPNITKIPPTVSSEPIEETTDITAVQDVVTENSIATNPSEIAPHSAEATNKVSEDTASLAPNTTSSSENSEAVVELTDKAEGVTLGEGTEETSNNVVIATNEGTPSVPLVEDTQKIHNEEMQTAVVADTVSHEATASNSPDPAPASVAVASYPQDILKIAPASQSAAAETSESPMLRTFGVENTDARVVVRATEESWVEVKSAGKKPVLSRVLKPGDVYMAPNTPNLKLATGNAGGLEIRVDGKEIKSLGGTGTILREVPLVAERLLGEGGLQ